MTDKQQIEEFTKITCDMYRRDYEKKCAGVQECDMKCLQYQRCEALYNIGWRKVPENAVVLTQEELEEMVKAKMKCINDMAMITRKEPAKEFWDKLQEIAVTSFLNSEGDICYLEEEYVSLRDIEKVLKQLGVEVEK